MAPNTYDVDSDYSVSLAPDAVVALMTDVTDAALTANVEVVHPMEVVVAPSGRRQLVLGGDLSGPPARAPELARGGPNPATLSYSVGVIAALAVLGTLDAPPDQPEPHRAWVAGITERLRRIWSGRPDGEEVVQWIGRCLAYDPDQRPHPRHLLDDLNRSRRRTSASLDATPRPVAAVVAPRPSPSLPPYAIALLVGAFLAFTIAVCTFGAAIEQVLAPLAPAAPEATALPPIAAPSRPTVVEFAPSPPIQPAPVVAAAPPETDASADLADTPPAPRPRAPAPVAPRPQPAPEPPPTTPQRPRPVPGSDLRDPWNR